MQVRFAERLERKQLRWQSAHLPAALAAGRAGNGRPADDAVLANAHLLQLVLDNLVDNAIKYTDPGGTVSVRLQRTAAGPQFEVADTGCGIAAEDQERVFERFYQAQRARSGPERGTGLGLSIVRHAVQALHGTVTLESKPGAGTRVTVVLPEIPPGYTPRKQNLALR